MMKNNKKNLKILASLFLFLLLFTRSSSSVHAWKFALAGDTRSGYEARRKIVQAIINKMPNDTRITVLNTGDITSTGSSGKWDYWKNDHAPLEIDWNKTNPPEFIASVGNHDAQESGWQDRWAGNLPAQKGLSAYPSIAAHSLGFYGSVKYENTIFIWVDSATRPSGQENFLEETLQSAAQDSQVTWKFVLFHYPPIPCGVKPDWSTGIRWHDDYFIPYGVDLVLLGHAHYYERTCPFASASSKTCQSAYRGNNIVGDPDPIHIISGGGGAPLYSPGSCSWLESKAEKHHFLEVEISGNVLNSKAWNTTDGSATNPVLIDDFTIQKGSGPTSTPTPPSSPTPSATPILSPTPTPTLPPLPGDLNGDSLINGVDFGYFVARYGTDDPEADLNGSGKVDAADILIFLKRYGFFLT